MLKAALRDSYREFAEPAGVFAGASVWIIGAQNPG